MTRTDTITAVLRHPQPVRDLLAYELGGTVVQLLAPGTTAPTWTATPQLLAEAIDTAVTRHDAAAAAAGPGAGHALVVHYDGTDLVGICQCGTPLGRAHPGKPLDALAVPWERHTALALPLARATA
ncbi:hypothetical protein [Streptomyces sp. NPDC018693]|uniref:hypothetical protein n=1 Tax=unclassified Streptomyces TaxID=2593676 RepID=UPI0037AF3A4A